MFVVVCMLRGVVVGVRECVGRGGTSGVFVLFFIIMV